PKNADTPLVVMTLDARQPVDPQNPPQWHLKTSTYKLPASDPLSSFKTNNKLLQVLARAEAEAADADDALMLNTNGEVAECSSANLFWIYRDTVYTTRSEERRVGKECRSRWSQDESKKKDNKTQGTIANLLTQ